ncbi:MAG: hypothetical protein JST54_31695 [Deltaproteobacteria bacterium]|nr:hypothetical protein [Deltaproteobacteria bacterium]
MRPALPRLDASTWAALTGALLRLAAFPFAEDLQGDAPVRSDIAQAWAHSPGLWWSYAHVLQFGPLPVHLEGILVRLGIPGLVGARLVPLALGIGGLFLTARVARRLGGPEVSALATWALALSPLHIQASTTCTSEAIFLFFVLVAIEGIICNRLALMILGAFCASTTRYDAWLWLPLVSALVAWRGQFKIQSLLAASLLALGPASILAANFVDGGHPFAPLDHISRDHVQLATAFAASWNPVLWRLGNVAFWPAATLVALTPVFAVLAIRALSKRPSADALIVLAIALVPTAIYAVRGLATGTFLPLLRMALVPAALLACVAPAVTRRGLTLAISAALVFDVGALALANLDTPVRALAERATPLERLPSDLRAGVAAVRESPGTVALDIGPRWEDIVIAHHAERDRFALYSPSTPPSRIISIRGGKLYSALNSTRRAFGRDCTPSGQVDRVAWWDCH